MKRLALLLSLFLLSLSPFTCPASAQGSATVVSPDGNVRARLSSQGGLRLAVSDQSQALLDVRLGLETIVDGKRRSLGDLRNVSTQYISETIAAPNYRQAWFTSQCNQMSVRLGDGTTLEVRAYDEGVAYRYLLPKARHPEENTVLEEVADFRPTALTDPVCYLPHSTNPKKPEAMAFQATYDVAPLSAQDTLPAFLPATLDFGNTKVTLMESDGEAYPGMFIQVKGEGGWMKGIFSEYPKTFDYYPWRRQKYVTATEDYIARGTTNTPWRIMAVAHDDREMPANNLVYALASPSRIADTSWIRPGRVAWDWWNDWGLSGVPFKAGINNETYRHYIDFASRYGLEYVILDEGWYEPKSGDMLRTIPDIDLPLLVQYARERGVRLILWTVFNVLDDQLEAACQRYAQMGIAGFKVDFLDRNDQEAVGMTYRIAEACARHHLLLDYHGIYAPTGIQRTWPNVVNFEAVFGMEEVKWTKHDERDMPQYDVTFPFIRGQAGYVDFTPGGMRNATRADFQPVYANPMTMGTRCHQLAHYIVHESPLTMLADSPTAYEREQECTRFIASLPSAYTSLRVLGGRMGEYIIVLRTDGEGNYYLGGETNWEARSVSVCLSDFLPAPDGQSDSPSRGAYAYELFLDGPNANHVATDYRIRKGTLERSDCLDIPMASGGGFAMKLMPVRP